MSKETINISDINLFHDTLVSLSKLTISAKFSIDKTGLYIYGKNSISRCELQSTAIASENPIEFCLLDINNLIKLVKTVIEVHQPEELIDVDFFFDYPFLKIESKKLKTKITTCKEDIITNSVSTKITATLTPIFEFTTTVANIKQLNKHTFLFPDMDSTRIYLNTQPDMENNMLYATLGNESNELNNSITLNFGLVNFGSLTNRVIINFERLALFNIANVDEIKIDLMDKNVLVNKVKMDGKNDSRSTITVYISILAK